MNHQNLLNNYLARYLKSYKSADCNKGFTLIELLVTVVIVGVLSAIALPNMLGVVAKARQTEAKTHISAINSAQEAYRLEKPEFAKTLDQLGVSIPASANNYTYKLVVDGEKASVLATAKDPATKPYSGGVVRFTNRENITSTAAIICENKLPGLDEPQPPDLKPTANTVEDAVGCDDAVSVQVK